MKGHQWDDTLSNWDKSWNYDKNRNYEIKVIIKS